MSSCVIACSFCLTTRAQRPGARNATIATTTLTPGSLERMVERSRCAGGFAVVDDNGGPGHTLRMHEHHYATTAKIHRSLPPVRRSLARKWTLKSAEASREGGSPSANSPRVPSKLISHGSRTSPGFTSAPRTPSGVRKSTRGYSTSSKSASFPTPRHPREHVSALPPGSLGRGPRHFLQEEREETEAEACRFSNMDFPQRRCGKVDHVGISASPRLCGS